MTGFLQRIAAAAIRPEPRLKPLVGSMYAGEPGMDFAEEKQSLLLDPPPQFARKRRRNLRPSEFETRATHAHERSETRITHAHEPSPRETPVHHEPLIAIASAVPAVACVRGLATDGSQANRLCPRDIRARAQRLQGNRRGNGPQLFLPAQHSGRTEEHSQPLATNPGGK